MPLVSMRRLLDEATKGGYGVGAFNVNNFEQVGASQLPVGEEGQSQRASCLRGWNLLISASSKMKDEAYLTLTRAQTPATRCKRRKREPRSYAVFASLCNALEPLTSSHYECAVSGSSPLVGSRFRLT